jgi:hypothetical protein
MKMRLRCVFPCIAGLTLLTLSIAVAPAAKGQTVISNETLVTTTFVVNKQDATAKCGKPGCHAKTTVLTAIPVTCPVPTGQTCTFHIFMDTKTSITSHCGTEGCLGPGPAGSYQFLVDGTAPTIGPTDENGYYLFAKNVVSTSNDGSFYRYASRQGYPASVLAGVTNSSSNNHTIDVNLACADANHEGGCEVTARWSTTRVDVFEP